MPHFQGSKNTTISTNLKVMYSSLKAQTSLQRMRRLAFSWMIFKEQMGLVSKQKHYLLVRNPYKKLESFFKNKLRRSVTSDNQWQASQRIFFPYLGIKTNDNPNEIEAKLKSISFQQFIEWLPLLYKKDRHLIPQYKIEYLNLGLWKRQIHFDEICRIEDTEELNKIAQELNIDLKIRVNSTKHMNTEIHWTPQLYKIVHRIYEQDFERYGYSYF